MSYILDNIFRTVNAFDFNNLKTNIISDNNSEHNYKNNKILPIGNGHYEKDFLIWKRSTIYSNYEISYKGKKYCVNYKELEKIYSRIDFDFDFESVVKLYLDNNMDLNTTITQLLV